MHQTLEEENPQVASLRCHSSLFVLIVVNIGTWVLLGTALIYALAVGRSPYYYAPPPTVARPAPVTYDIFMAASEGGTSESPQLRDLLNQGIPANQLDAGGLSPLWHAVAVQNEANIALLLKHGADPNLRSASSEPILVAALNSLAYDPEQANRVAALLLEHGADADGLSPYTRQRAIHIAASLGQTASVRELLAWGADPDASDPNGNTALHLSLSQQNPELVALLLDNGADPDRKNNTGQTPRAMAEPHPPLAAVFATHAPLDDRQRP